MELLAAIFVLGLAASAFGLVTLLAFGDDLKKISVGPKPSAIPSLEDQLKENKRLAAAEVVDWDKRFKELAWDQDKRKIPAPLNRQLPDPRWAREAEEAKKKAFAPAPEPTRYYHPAYAPVYGYAGSTVVQNHAFATQVGGPVYGYLPVYTAPARMTHEYGIVEKEVSDRQMETYKVMARARAIEAVTLDALIQEYTFGRISFDEFSRLRKGLRRGEQ